MFVPPMPSLLAFISVPGGWEWLVILVIGLLIFGRRLPEVSRSIGKSIVEFKRGLKNIEDDIEEESSRPAERSASPATLPGGTGADPAGQPQAAESKVAGSGDGNSYRPADV